MMDGCWNVFTRGGMCDLWNSKKGKKSYVYYMLDKSIRVYTAI